MSAEPQMWRTEVMPTRRFVLPADDYFGSPLTERRLVARKAAVRSLSKGAANLSLF